MFGKCGAEWNPARRLVNAAARVTHPPRLARRTSATLVKVKTARIAKIAGLSLAGFVAASMVADKVNLNPLASQMAGFAGAFLGTLAGRRRRALRRIADRGPRGNNKTSA